MIFICLGHDSERKVEMSGAESSVRHLLPILFSTQHKVRKINKHIQQWKLWKSLQHEKWSEKSLPRDFNRLGSQNKNVYNKIIFWKIAEKSDGLRFVDTYRKVTNMSQKQEIENINWVSIERKNIPDASSTWECFRNNRHQGSWSYVREVEGGGDSFRDVTRHVKTGQVIQAVRGECSPAGALLLLQRYQFWIFDFQTPRP